MPEFLPAPQLPHGLAAEIIRMASQSGAPWQRLAQSLGNNLNDVADNYASRQQMAGQNLNPDQLRAILQGLPQNVGGRQVQTPNGQITVGQTSPLGQVFPKGINPRAQGMALKASESKEAANRAAIKDHTPVTDEMIKNFPIVSKLGFNVGEYIPNRFLGATGKTDREKAPPGYRYSADGKSLEAIPGGPAEHKLDKEGEKEEAGAKASIEQAHSQIDKVDDALKKVSGWTTGWGGSVMGKIPGSHAVDLEGDLDTIKANLGFSTLAEMRKASPTGGALGAISEREMTLLTAARESLDSRQSKEQLKKNLQAVKTHYTNWSKAVEDSRKENKSGKSANGDSGATPKKIGRFTVEVHP